MQREEDEKLFLALRAGTISIVRAAASNLYQFTWRRACFRIDPGGRPVCIQIRQPVIVPVGKDHACTWEKPGFSHDIFGVLHIMSLWSYRNKKYFYYWRKCSHDIKTRIVSSH